MNKANKIEPKEDLFNLNNIYVAKSNKFYRSFIGRVDDKQFSVHESIEIIYIIEGMIEIYLEDYSTVLKKGDIFIIDSNKSHLLKKLTPNIILSTQFNKKLIYDNFLNVSINEIDVKFTNNFDDKLKKNNIIFALGSLFLSQYKVENSIEDKIKIMEYLFDNLKSNTIYYKKNSDKYKKIDISVKSIILKIAEDYTYNEGEDPKLTDLSEKYNLSPSYLSRMFKKYVGLNITEYYRKRKVNKAIDYLINTDYSISEISEKSGFNDIKAMNRDFHKEVGASASDIRAEYRVLLGTIVKDYFEHDTVYNYFKKIESQLNDYKWVSNTKLSKKYILSNSNNKKTILKNYIGTNVLELNNFFATNLLEKDLLLRDCSLDELIISLKINKDGIYVKISNNKYREFSIIEYDYLIRFLKNNNINPIIRVDFTNIINNYNSIEENRFRENCMYLENIMDMSIRKLGIKEFRDWKFEFYISDFEKIKQGSNDKILSCINRSFSFLVDNLNVSRNNFGIHFGRVAVNSKEDLLSIKADFNKIIEEHTRLGFFSYDIVINFTDIRSDNFISKLESTINEIDNIINKNKNIINTYIRISYIEGSELNSISNYKKQFFNKLYLYILTNIDIKNHQKIYQLDIIESLEGSTISKLGDFYNKYGVLGSSYYLYKFLSKFRGNILSKEDGCCVVTDNKSKKFILYSNPIEYLDNIIENKKQNNLDLKSKDRTYNIIIDNIKGRYKIVEHIIDYDSLHFYDDWVQDVGYYDLNTTEKDYVEKKSIPSMRVKYLDIQDRLDYSVKVNMFDIVFLEIKEI